MPMNAVQAALVEVQVRLEAIKPAHEGLRDFDSLNLHADTEAQVQDELREFNHMKDLMEQFVAAAEALVNANYPNLEPRGVTEVVLADLQNQLDTITAARAQFIHSEAVSGEMTFTEPKE
jgi:hypothetical protein